MSITLLLAELEGLRAVGEEGLLHVGNNLSMAKR